MTVFIHIGFPKTGTTSIQSALASNARMLRETRSLYYPGFAVKQWPALLPFVDPDRFEPLDNFVRRGRGTREEALAKGQAFLREFTEAARRYETHVVSAEQVPLLDRGSLSAFRDFFLGLGLSTKIVAYVRHPADRLSSMISQQLLGGHADLASFRFEDDVKPALQRLVDVFGRQNMIVRRFGTKYFANQDLLTDFLEAIGQAPLDVEPARRNESLSLPAILVADKLFGVASLASGRRGNDRYLQRISGAKFRAPRPLVEKTLEEHADCLRYLEQEFGLRFDPIDLSTFPEDIPGAVSGDALTSIAEILNEQSRTIGELRGELDALYGQGLWSRLAGLFARRRRRAVPKEAEPPAALPR